MPSKNAEPAITADQEIAKSPTFWKAQTIYKIPSIGKTIAPTSSLFQEISKTIAKM